MVSNMSIRLTTKLWLDFINFDQTLLLLAAPMRGYNEVVRTRLISGKSYST
jgi:hypothetical protein